MKGIESMEFVGKTSGKGIEDRRTEKKQIGEKQISLPKIGLLKDRGEPPSTVNPSKQVNSGDLARGCLNYGSDEHLKKPEETYSKSTNTLKGELQRNIKKCDFEIKAEKLNDDQKKIKKLRAEKKSYKTKLRLIELKEDIRREDGFRRADYHKKKFDITYDLNNWKNYMGDIKTLLPLGDIRRSNLEKDVQFCIAMKEEELRELYEEEHERRKKYKIIEGEIASGVIFDTDKSTVPNDYFDEIMDNISQSNEWIKQKAQDGREFRLERDLEAEKDLEREIARALGKPWREGGNMSGTTRYSKSEKRLSTNKERSRKPKEINAAMQATRKRLVDELSQARQDQDWEQMNTIVSKLDKLDSQLKELASN